MSMGDLAKRAATPFETRLLAEAIRRQEETTGGEPDADAATELAAISTGGDFEARVRARADAIAQRSGLHRTLASYRRTAAISVAIVIAAGVFLGAGAAQATLTPDRAGLVNFYLVLLALLGVHTLALLLWLLSIVFSPRLAPATPLRPLLRSLLGAFAAPAAKDRPHTSAMGTWTGLLTSGAMGRWLVSALIHAFWLAVLIGMLGAVLLLLSARQFDFVWETTILPDNAFVNVTERLSEAPRGMGLPAPTHEQILASRRDASVRPPAEARRLWSGLLIGSLIAYAIAPRAALFVIAMLLSRRARQRFRLDLDLPGYARLRPLLMPSSRRAGIVDADSAAANAARPDSLIRRLPVGTQLAVLGLEIDAPSSGWPPPLAPRANDLGIVMDRDAQRAALRALAAMQRAPVALLLVASLAASPDRGVGRLLREIRAIHHGPLALLLTQSDSAQARLGDHAFAERLGDWRQLAINAGIAAGSIGVLDLDDVAAVREFLAARDPVNGERPSA